MCSKEKDETCLGFLENIFTKSVHRGGMCKLCPKFFSSICFDNNLTCQNTNCLSPSRYEPLTNNTEMVQLTTKEKYKKWTWKTKCYPSRIDHPFVVWSEAQSVFQIKCSLKAYSIYVHNLKKDLVTTLITLLSVSVLLNVLVWNFSKTFY